jgi:assimilatory nitrate reductase catalytic subunit
LSGQPELKATAAKLAPLATLWRGLLITTVSPPRLDGFYGARFPVRGGNAVELRGWDPLPVGEGMRALAQALVVPSPDAEWLEWIDEGSGSFRYASIVRGKLESCLLVSSRARWALPDRDAVTALLGAEFGARSEAIIVAMSPAQSASPGAGRKVCSCFSVSRASIEEAIVAGGLASAAAIGAAVRAGTNCGSCIPELDEILRDVKARPSAAADPVRLPSPVRA